MGVEAAKRMDEARRPGSSGFGTLLRHYRLAAGLSQEALAERARLSMDGISALERGYRRAPQRETLALLAGALTLNEEQRQAFESAACRPSSPRHRASSVVTVGPWRSVRSTALPLALTSFIGRQAELDEITALVRDCRLVTITGAGGIGKTQTALRVAETLSDATNTAACFVALAPIGDPAFVVKTIATTAGVQEVPNHPLLETLTAYLKNKTLLLILDNCEHVIQAAAAVANSLLLGCPRVRILATSRETLRTPGERAYRLPSLRTDDAGALFADRAQAVDASFRLTDESRPLVAGICRRLDGIPLAIELAAARVNVLSLEALARSLDKRFAVLTSGQRTVLLRQQTMRATIDWSYDLLSPPEKRTFERLSVFAGACTFDAVTRVCTDGPVAETALLDLLTSLVNKSLLTAELDESEPRYRLLESFREYARERLVARGEQHSVAHRHARSCREMIARSKLEPMAAWIRSWQDDCRAALQWSLIERGNVALGQDLVAELATLWARSPAEGRRWVALANELVDEQTPTRVVAMLKFCEAVIASQFGDYETQLACSEEATLLLRAVNEPGIMACAQRVAGGALCKLGRVAEAQALLEDALATSRRLGDHVTVATILEKLAESKAQARDICAARSCIAEAIQIFKECKHERYVAVATMDLGEFEALAGNYETSLSHSKRALEMSRANNDTIVIVECLNAVAESLVQLNHFDEAQHYACEALALALEHQFAFQAVRALYRISSIAVHCLQGTAARESVMRVKAAARMLGFADAYFDRSRLKLQGPEIEHRKQLIAALTDAIPASELTRLLAEGAAMTEEQVFAEASELKHGLH